MMALASGILMACAVTIIVFIGYSLLITYSGVTEKNIPVVVVITSIASVIIAGFDAARGAEKNGWLWGIVAGVIYAVILLLVGFAVSKGIRFDSRTVTLLAVSIAGGGLGGVLGINVKAR